MNTEYRIDSENKWIPDGFHFLGPEAAKKRRRLLLTARTFFEEQGFLEVIPPAFDFSSTFYSHLSSGERDSILKLKDLNGYEVSPSVDLTLQVVKGMAGFARKNEDNRVFYTGKVIKDNRRENADRREFQQFGVEILGSSGYDTLLELFFSIDGLMSKLGIEGNQFTLVLGNVQVYSGLARCMGLDTGDMQKLSQLVYAKNRLDMHAFLEEKGVGKEFGRTLDKMLLSFSLDEIKPDLLKVSEKNSLGLEVCIAETEKILQANSKLKHLELCLDYSLLRDLDYYTGFVFHAYVSGIPMPVFMGGAYDHLYEKFSGVQKNACGFALNLELLQILLDK
ncbi:MAG: ATP phosphoribosyltransferase regulatory subunit [Leptospiraceae bacterium]|nr:ATP phosphoribosyltransferase regulatory subunit [Leptospiraceae bacterium]